MTREERENALHCLKVMIDEEVCEECKLYGSTGTDHCEADCVRIAIKALEQEPCEDCISRQAVLDVIEREEFKGDAISEIEKLSSVISQPKTGHWMTQWNAAHQKEYYYCSECREEFSYDGETGVKMNDYDYCPKCGAKMESEV